MDDINVLERIYREVRLEKTADTLTETERDFIGRKLFDNKDLIANVVATILKARELDKQPGDVVDEDEDVTDEFEFRLNNDGHGYLVRIYHYRDSGKPVRVITNDSTSQIIS